jgi:NitT/TauT family transport system substrate-binding protein
MARWSMKVQTSVVAVALASAAVAAGCGSSDDDSGKASTTASNGPTRVRVAFFPALGNLPVRYAAENGIFKKNGLDVKLTEGTDQAAWTAALGKQFDIGGSAPEALLTGATAGLPLVAVSNVVMASNDQPVNVLVSKSAIANYATLKGKAVGIVTLAGSTYDAVRYLAAKAGISASDVKMTQTPLPTMSAQVKLGKLYAAVSTSPFFSIPVDGVVAGKEDPTVAAVTAASDGAQTSTPAGIMVSTKKWAAGHPAAVAAFRRSIAQASAYLNAHPDQARAAVQQWLKLPPPVAKAAPLPAYTADLTPQMLQPWVEIAKVTGTLRKSPPPVQSLVWQTSS